MERFEVIHKEGFVLKREGLRQILVDRETGVNYLLWQSGYSGGVTPLLDAEGKPVVSQHTPKKWTIDFRNQL